METTTLATSITGEKMPVFEGEQRRVFVCFRNERDPGPFKSALLKSRSSLEKFAHRSAISKTSIARASRKKKHSHLP